MKSSGFFFNPNVIHLSKISAMVLNKLSFICHGQIILEQVNAFLEQTCTLNTTKFIYSSIQQFMATKSLTSEEIQKSIQNYQPI